MNKIDKKIEKIREKGRKLYKEKVVNRKEKTPITKCPEFGSICKDCFYEEKIKGSDKL